MMTLTGLLTIIGFILSVIVMGMAVQNRADQSNTPLILSDDSDVMNGTIIQDERRGAGVDLLYGTVMAQISASGLWTPFVSVAGVDGSGVPRGIYLGDDIAASDLVEDNIEDCPILVGNARVNEQLVIWDQDILDADTVVAPATVEARTARKALADAANIRLEETVDSTAHEN
jgi:hypothetical protein